LLQPALAGRHDRKLLHGKKAVQQNEKEDDHDLEEDDGHFICEGRWNPKLGARLSVPGVRPNSSK
jgi:hypothetical protein